MPPKADPDERKRREMYQDLSSFYKLALPALQRGATIENVMIMFPSDVLNNGEIDNFITEKKAEVAVKPDPNLKDYIE